MLMLEWLPLQTYCLLRRLDSLKAPAVVSPRGPKLAAGPPHPIQNIEHLHPSVLLPPLPPLILIGLNASMNLACS